MGFFLVMQMQQVAQGWLVYDLTNSPLALGLLMLSFMGPTAVFSLFGGVLADKLPKTKLIMATQSFNVVIALILAVLVHTNQITFAHLLILGVFNGTLMALQMPSRRTLIPEIVGEERLMNAIALDTSGANLSRIVGPALAGVLIGILGTASVFYLMAGIAASSIFCISRISIRSPLIRATSGMNREIIEGIKYMSRNPALLGLLIMAFVPMSIGMMSFHNLMPAWSVEALDLGPEGLGLLLAMTGIGAVFGSLFVASLGNFRRRGLLLIGTSLLWAVLIVAFAQSTVLLLALVLLVGVGFFSSIYLSLNQSLTQIYASPEMRGRVMSISMLSFGVMPLAVLPISALAERIGTPDALAVSAVLLLGFVLAFGILNPRFRCLE